MLFQSTSISHCFYKPSRRMAGRVSGSGNEQAETSGCWHFLYMCQKGGREWGRGATVCHMPPHFGLCKCCRWRRLRCAVDMARKSNRIIQFQYKDDDDKSQPKSTVDKERETRARRDKHERAQTGKGSLGNCIHKQIQFHVPHKKLISKSRAARQPAVAIYLLSSHLSPVPLLPFPPSWGKEK